MPASPKATSRWFTLIALLIPVLVLAAVEGGLRIAGFGKTYPLFVPASQPGYLVPNPELIQRYFHVGAPAPNVSPDTYYFEKNKPADQLRIVLMGGSTAAGFPYGRFGSPAGLLEARLQAEYPNLDVRIISVAMSSVNSYTLRDITDEVIGIQPDAVLIYAGHNEYLGVMGAGSVYAGFGSHFANVMFLKLKELRLFQALQWLMQPRSQPTPGNGDARTVMAQVAQSQHIPYNSAVFKAGEFQFTDNMAAVLSQLNDAGVPTLVSSIAANLQHQPPFASAPLANSDSNSISSAATNTLSSQHADALAGIASADVHYRLASAALPDSPGLALTHFIHAMDADLLRFRAPSHFNTLLKQLAHTPHATWVDSYSLLAAHSPNDIIGESLMLEHLHPNEKGYFLIAEAFYQQLKAQHILPEPVHSLSADEAWQQRPLTAVDARVTELKIANLTSDYPFQRSHTPFTPPAANSAVGRFALARYNGTPWLAQQPRLLTWYQQQEDWESAANVAAALASALPFKADIAQVAAQLSLRAGRPFRAWYFARQAVTHDNNSLMYQLTLAESLFKAGQKSAAIRQLRAAKEQFPDSQRPDYFLQQLGAS
ncbi:hypothetical protein OCL06_06550 [Alteromonas sp. ASW11-19]|uniref:SGNH hydrolase-type esterase domain-containing protein n=1 Tax=Alteromonas salexigens TaxID=2982530 RepID=A0ABT2VN13_9ALTE|nr:hypothetical protein [Alteromonas salexigens]MCU7554252.1 hypothetical protein [Alteromonas salexigens]